jgi:hypothetical protein
MENSNKQAFTQDEVKKYVNDYIMQFLRILRILVYSDMKKLGIDSLESYVGFLLLEYYVQKKRAESNTIEHASKN